MKETALVHQVIDYLELKGHLVTRFNTGAARATSSTGRQYMLRFGSVGWADVMGTEKGTGTTIAVECKVGKNTRTEAQIRFANWVLANNAIYILAYSLDDVINYFDKRDAIRRSRLAA